MSQTRMSLNDGAGTYFRSRRARVSETLWAYAFLAPSLVIFAVFVFYPLIRTAHQTFYQPGLYPDAPQRYIGWEQWTDVLGDSDFHATILRTLLLSLMTVLPALVLGLLLAWLVNQPLRGMSLFRIVFSTPVATSVAVASLVFLILLNPQGGILKVDWLTRPTPALMSVALTNVWQNLGITFIIILAGLQSVPDDLIEAAKIDGAGPWRRLRSVIIPTISPTLMFAFVILTIVSFQTFGQIDILTQGGPQDATRVIVYDIFTNRGSDPGAAAVKSIVLFGGLVLLTFIQFAALNRRVHYGD
ncbi:MAG: sugar ABC transporter permease [Actinobacteria bacterium]|nr:sugar ABC transporter permease [Actinomycetota bacterium]MCB9390058.1 sugar ABC transporter permease [Acidimicrobiia bacterium]